MTEPKVTQAVGAGGESKRMTTAPPRSQQGPALEPQHTVDPYLQPLFPGALSPQPNCLSSHSPSVQKYHHTHRRGLDGQCIKLILREGVRFLSSCLS